ncbi:aldo/keto reductase [Evansella sp. AB-rgal1]|uniref:aldo/keto reductase n=1 Tax=Evansella sp. AB-rgal1 TaxID=3242696 RepID=UPI00359E2240
MKKNKLGHSELYVSEIGFGCMSLTGDQQTNERLLHEAISNGVNFFDTADLYDKGMNEISVGKALKGKRSDILLASKGGNEWTEGKDGWNWNPTKSYLKTAVEKSLHRLQTDYLDLYQLHGGTMEDPIEETIEAFDELVKEGKIRYYGISSIRPNVIKTYLEKSNITSIMMQFSLLDRRPEEWFSVIEEKNVSIIARGPVAKGLLTDNYDKKLSEQGYLTYSGEDLKMTLQQLRNFANTNELTLQELALRYSLDHSVVATVIPGASQVDQVKENIIASTKPALTEDTKKQLQMMTKEWKYEQHRD